MIQNHDMKRAFFWNSTGSTINLVCQWLTTVLIVRLSDDYVDAGNYALAISGTAVFFYMAVYNMRAFQVSDTCNEYSDRDYIATRIVTIAFALLGCGIFVMAMKYTGTQRTVIMLFMLFRAFEAFSDVLYGIEQKAWRLDLAGISLFIRGILLLIAFVILQLLFDLKIAVFGIVLSSLVVIVLFDLPKTKKLSPNMMTVQFNTNIFRLLKKCFPLAITAVLTALTIPFSRFILEKICGTEVLGIYASIAAPALIVQLAAGFIFSPLITLFADYASNGHRKAFVMLFAKCCMAIAGIIGICLIGAVFFGEWGLFLLFGETIRPYSYLLFNAIVVTGLTAFVYFFSAVLTVLRDMKGIIIGNTIGFTVCAITAGKLIAYYGISGINYTMIFSMGTGMIILLIACLRDYFKMSIIVN
ncbi:hypothetical protein FACS189476_10320 [Spirochaetia bacterium]|nr:hypothetical protein FACS189476_10320 [Spirochaetia bacterium]